MKYVWKVLEDDGYVKMDWDMDLEHAIVEKQYPNFYPKNNTPKVMAMDGAAYIGEKQLIFFKKGTPMEEVKQKVISTVQHYYRTKKLSQV
jgi:hypothetical protein